MNREIKFRAWDAQLGEMYTPEFPYIGAGSSARDIAIMINGAVITPSSYDLDVFSAFKPPVPELVLMQFTGLKDKNGVDVYEGDVVQYRVSEQGKETQSYPRKEIVQFYCGAFKIGPAALSEWTHENGLVDGQLKNRYYIGFGQKDIYMIDFDLEVIGNIFQNPELLNL